VPSIILAQLAVACAFVVRTMRVTFDQLSPRTELVAMTLGCSRSQAFWRIVLPECQRGLVTAFTLSWARSLGEFGPILVFSGVIREKTEVLSTSVYLELNMGQIESAVAVALLMVVIAGLVLSRGQDGRTSWSAGRINSPRTKIQGPKSNAERR